MKRIITLLLIAIFFGGVSTQAQLQHTWEEVDQAVTDVQNAQPLPAGKLVPDGGTTGQVLEKRSDANGDTGWSNASGGTDVKWYRQIGGDNLSYAYILARPFENWKFTNIVGLTDTGTVDIDIQHCDASNVCTSYLSGVATIGNPETTINLNADGITANYYVKVIPSNAQGGATRFNIYAAGLYGAGTPPAGSNNCVPGDAYIGWKDLLTDDETLAGTDTVLIHFTAPCSGTIDQVFLYQNMDTALDVDVGIYKDDGDGIPNSADTFLAHGIVSFTSNGSGAYRSISTSSNVNTTEGEHYWIAYSRASGSVNVILLGLRDATGNVAYYTSTNYANNFPPDLGGVSWNQGSNRKVNVYFTGVAK